MKHSVILLLSLVLITSSCKTTRTQRGAVIGAGTGAAIGAVIGQTAGNAGAGAVIGATVGGVAGAVIGKQMDKQAEEIKNQVPNAEVVHNPGEEGILVNFKSKVLFATEQYALTETSKATISELAGILIKYPETNITVQGHTDSRGTDAYNQTLSENRARSVSDFIKMKGVAVERVTSVGYGETQPVATNDTPEGRAENRRVTFVITANEKMKQDAIKEASK